MASLQYATKICDEENNQNVLAMCTSSGITGSTIFIDTSIVPTNESMVCNCSVNLDPAFRNIDVAYHVVDADTKTCGRCSGHRLTPIFNNFDTIFFSKTTVGANTCLAIFIDRTLDEKSKANATIKCYEATQVETFSNLSGTSTITLMSRLDTLSNVLDQMTNSLTLDAHLNKAAVNRSSIGISSIDNDKGVQINTALVGEAVGGSAGGIVVITGIIILMICYCRKRKPIYETVRRPRSNVEHIYSQASNSYDGKVSDSISDTAVYEDPVCSVEHIYSGASHSHEDEISNGKNDPMLYESSVRRPRLHAEHIYSVANPTYDGEPSDPINEPLEYENLVLRRRSNFEHAFNVANPSYDRELSDRTDDPLYYNNP